LIISILKDGFTLWPGRLYYSMNLLPLWQLPPNLPATHYHRLKTFTMQIIRTLKSACTWKSRRGFVL